MKELILLRGLPGSGKSTLAKSLDGIHIEADQFFMIDGEYRFDASKLKDAHNYCFTRTKSYMYIHSSKDTAERNQPIKSMFTFDHHEIVENYK